MLCSPLSAWLFKVALTLRREDRGLTTDRFAVGRFPARGLAPIVRSTRRALGALGACPPFCRQRSMFAFVFSSNRVFLPLNAIRSPWPRRSFAKKMFFASFGHPACLALRLASARTHDRRFTSAARRYINTALRTTHIKGAKWGEKCARVCPPEKANRKAPPSRETPPDLPLTGIPALIATDHFSQFLTCQLQ